MARYLVTGGCGFIGSHLVDTLLHTGHEVLVLDNLSSGKMENVDPKAKVTIGDVADTALVQQCLEQADGCFHLAAIASVEQSTREWSKSHQVNAAATINIFQASSRLKKPVPVVYASSAAVYGNCNDLPLSETSEAQPLSAYGADKLTCELHGQVADRIHHVPNIGFRFFNVYGPRQNPHSPYSGVVSIFLDNILHKKDITIYGDGEQIRDFVFVQDVINALNTGMKRLHHAAEGHEVFNVCTGKDISVNHLAYTIENITGHQVKHIHLPAREGDLRVSIGNPKKLENVLYVKARTTLETGLVKLCDFTMQAEGKRRVV